MTPHNQRQELVLSRQWARDHATAESRRARQEIYAALFACPTSPATIKALESIHQILGRPLSSQRVEETQ